MVQNPAPGNLIVIVDDDINIRKALGIILRKEHFDVIEASCGQELHDILHRLRPRLIFLDVMMPGENGFDLCAELKTDTSTAGIHIFLVTARGMRQDVNKGFSMGADEYVLKPFFTKDVLALVRKYLRTAPIDQCTQQKTIPAN